ncbi:MAG: hypothetical protein QE284_11370 [Rhizobium sp.]|nr:hypothetical protein [Rhizobium sp.]
MQTTTDIHNPLPADETHVVPAPITQFDEPVRIEERTRAEIRRSYPAAAFRGPLFEARDRVALVMATIMLIGPLVALPLGF